MNFEELSDDEWTLVASLVADEPLIRLNRRGRPRAEPRVVANAVLWILSTGESWSRLPARYPSGPTCRRRFDEWHANGTLLEIVKRLALGGRQFIYVPEPVAPVTPEAAEQTAEDDGLPSVYWKSPEAWQASAAGTDTLAADPIERITRELAPAAAPVVAQTVPFVPASTAAPASVPVRASVPLVVPAGHSVPSVPVPQAVASPAACPLPPAAPVPLARTAPLPDPHEDDLASARGPLWTSDGPQSVEMTEWRGYMMNLEVQPARNGLFRAAVEILKDDKRVERSGLIGPPFEELEAAKQFAFDWARDWIDRECGAGPTPASAGPARAGSACPGNTVVTRSMPSSATSVATGVRLAPVQRYCLAGPLKPAHDGRDAAAPASAERRAVDLPWRPEPRTHLG